MSTLSILVTSAGRRVALLTCIRESAKRLGVEVKLLAVDARPESSAACYIADNAFTVPSCASPDFESVFIELCSRERVGLVIPTIDTELQVLARLAPRLALTGTQIAISDVSTIDLLRNKQRATEHIRSRGLSVPRTVMAASVLDDPAAWSWPLYVKPIAGSSSVGAMPVTDAATLDTLVRQRGDLIAQELVPGDEYTINLYFDRAGTLRSVVPHQRLEVRAGEVSKGITRKDPRLIELGRAFARAVSGLRGAICIQAFLGSEENAIAKVTDFNARFGGGYPIAHAAGAEFTTWLIDEALGKTRSWGKLDSFQDGLLMLRYDEAVFVSGNRKC